MEYKAPVLLRDLLTLEMSKDKFEKIILQIISREQEIKVSHEQLCRAILYTTAIAHDPATFNRETFHRFLNKDEYSNEQIAEVIVLCIALGVFESTLDERFIIKDTELKAILASILSQYTE